MITETTVTLFAGLNGNGDSVYEHVLVEPLEDGRYRLLQSPQFVLGIAAGDVFEVIGDRRPSVTERGGNLCVQVYVHTPVDEVERVAMELLKPLNVRLDGKTAAELVFTIPLVAGNFVPVEAALARLVERCPSIEWFYNNVYDDLDGITPLDWWKPTRTRPR
jgi:hypothetical protein